MKLTFFSDYDSKQQLFNNLGKLEAVVTNQKMPADTVISHFEEAVHSTAFPFEAVSIFREAYSRMVKKPVEARDIGLRALQQYQNSQLEREEAARQLLTARFAR